VGKVGIATNSLEDLDLQLKVEMQTTGFQNFVISADAILEEFFQLLGGKCREGENYSKLPSKVCETIMKKRKTGTTAVPG
jgi:hypothetical protein